ncbi:sirohydrochlorin nickelochelatase [Candidatus Bathyarchaeota archaeon A05DMB-2]|jgi:precorrin-8X/cobalt-precorrin-8 methylmutase|nr:sirohydrochlorin nickelochelatase [Candidatus Bathyarchaeota archaeon A05DMB-2]
MNKIGLIIIGHGSKLPHNRENLEKLAEIVRKRSKFKTVQISFMVRNKPTIPEAIESVAKKGVSKIVLVPAFLAPGVHTTQEIPELIGLKEQELALKARGIQLIYGEPLGADERIADIIEEKAMHALGQVSSESVLTDAYAIAASKKIADTSMNIIRQELGDSLKNAPKCHVPIIERVIHTTADPEFAKLLFISENAVEAGIGAIRSGAKIVTDVKMVKAGINAARLKKFGARILTYVDDKRTVEIAKSQGLTRSAAAMRLAIKEGLNGAVVLIGNAPTAAFELANAVEKGLAKPALIVAVPVGYVGAAESKDMISKLSTSFIIIRGRKGGSTIAVAIFNALLSMAEQNASKA